MCPRPGSDLETLILRGKNVMDTKITWDGRYLTEFCYSLIHTLIPASLRLQLEHHDNCSLLFVTMSAQFDIYYRIFAAKLEQNALAVVGWGILSAVLFGALFIWSFAIDAGMPKLPIAMQEEVPNRKKRVDLFVKETRRLLIDSYNKVQ
jgi:hypothetical protein